MRLHPVDFRREDPLCKGDDPEPPEGVRAQETGEVFRDRFGPAELHDLLGSALHVNVELLVAQSSGDDRHPVEIETNVL